MRYGRMLVSSWYCIFHVGCLSKSLSWKLFFSSGNLSFPGRTKVFHFKLFVSQRAQPSQKYTNTFRNSFLLMVREGVTKIWPAWPTGIQCLRSSLIVWASTLPTINLGPAGQRPAWAYLIKIIIFILIIIIISIIIIDWNLVLKCCLWRRRKLERKC